MSAGLPGFGLGGLFFICSALLAPIFEVPRTIQGRSSRARWGRILGHLSLALAMIVAVEVTLEVVVTAIGVGATHGAGTAGAGSAARVAGGAARASGGGISLAPLPVPPVIVTSAVLASVLAIAKGADLVVRLRIASRSSSAVRSFAAARALVWRRLAERTRS